MDNYILSCCSAADFTKEHLDRIDVRYTYLHFKLGDTWYDDDLSDKTVSIDTFYKKMAEGADTSTSQVNSDEYERYFRSFLEQGLDVLHLCLSSGISGTLNSALIARDALREEFPDRKLYVLDSLSASSGFGMVMDRLSELRAEGKSIDEVYEWAKANVIRAQHWFTTSDLTYLIKGGRVSKAAGMIGSVLNICPVLNVDYQGRLISRAKVRGKKKAYQELVKRMEENTEEGTEYAGKCYISHSYCPEDAKMLSDMIKERFPKLNGDPELNCIGTTIGSHTGPGLVALFFWGKERID